MICAPVICVTADTIQSDSFFSQSEGISVSELSYALEKETSHLLGLPEHQGRRCARPYSVSEQEARGRVSGVIIGLSLTRKILNPRKARRSQIASVFHTVTACILTVFSTDLCITVLVGK